MEEVDKERKRGKKKEDGENEEEEEEREGGGIQLTHASAVKSSPLRSCF